MSSCGSLHGHSRCLSGWPAAAQILVLLLQRCIRFPTCLFGAQHPIGFHPSVSGKRAADGSFLTRNTAAYPASLALSLAKLAAPWLSTDTSGNVPVALATWHSLLPGRLPWPVLKHRVEDGAGTCSTARPDPAKFSDPFRSLRTSWSRRFLRDGLAVRIASALNSGSREPPLSESELEPFLSDLRSFLGH